MYQVESTEFLRDMVIEIIYEMGGKNIRSLAKVLEGGGGV